MTGSRTARSPRPGRAGLAFLVALGMALGGCAPGVGRGSASRAAPAPARASAAAAADCLDPAEGKFLSTDGTRLVCGPRPVVLSGFTMYPSAIGGSAAWHTPAFHSYIDRMLDLGAAAGLNLVRPTDEWDRHTANQSWSDPAVWDNLDYLVAGARRRGMFVVMDLSALRWLLVSQGRDPFDPAEWRDFVAFATARYRDEPALAFYSIVGEPAPPHTPAELDRLVGFYSAVLGMVHAGDPRHLATIGALNHMEDEKPGLPWWHTLFGLPGNDLVAFKTYSQHDLDLLPVIATYAHQAGKPLVEGEFGMPQGAGDDVPSPGSVFNGLAEGRAAFFDQVYRAGDSDGFAAYVFWNLGCEIGPGSFEVSPRTPAVWRVILNHAPEAPSSPGPAECSPA